jgi:hypothetical protein
VLDNVMPGVETPGYHQELLRDRRRSCRRCIGCAIVNSQEVQEVTPGGILLAPRAPMHHYVGNTDTE